MSESNWTRWPTHVGWWWMDEGAYVLPVEVRPVDWHPSGVFPFLRGVAVASGQGPTLWFTPAVAPDNSPAQQELPW